jgi:thymidylate synthase
MALPSFTHIHSSSRFDRPASVFEEATDNFMKHCSILTVTEIHQNNKAAVLREKGWNYYNAKAGKQGADNCGVAWNRDVWACTWQGSRKLHQKGYKRFKAHLPAPYVHACTVVLKHRASGKKLMVSVTHMPAWVDKVGPAPGFKTHGYDWRSRKEAYIESVKTWSVWTEHMIRKHNLDGVLIVSDWNLNMKDKWFQNFLRDHWGKAYKMTWRHFPASGGSMSPHGKIIDGSLVRHLAIEDGGAELMPRTPSSDHRPYKERLRFAKGELVQSDEDDPDGDVRKGKPWWGFGDYDDDFLYGIVRETEDA